MQLPARIGKYELEEFLGGGMSHVFRATDTVLGRTVAVKVLTDSACAQPDAKARFLAEARMASKLAHDNILSIYDFGEDEQHRPFMVMELLRGENLRDAIRNGNTGDLQSKIRIALQIARALQYIHSQKVIHRDIKPENVHLNSAGVAKLMDFGIAKTEGLSMTRTGFVLGTPYYMAPEQVTGKELTEQVDVYAFGVLLFELMTGTKPIAGDTVERIFYVILNEPLDLAPMVASGAPPAICDLVGQCTAKDPAARPQGFSPVRAFLEGLTTPSGAPPAVTAQAGGAAAAPATAPAVDTSTPAPQTAATPRRRGLRVSMWIAAALVVLLGSGFAFVWFQRHQLDSRFRAAADAISAAGIGADGLVSADAVRQFDILHGYLDSVDRYHRESAPLVYRLGSWLQGDPYPSARRLYFDRFRTFFLGPAHNNQVQYLRGLPATPGPPYGPVYEALKSYLMTTSEPAKSDPSFLVPGMMRWWGAGLNAGADRDQGARRQFEFYAQELRQDDPFPLDNDREAVDKVRRYLGQFGGVERVYTFLLADAEKHTTALNFNRQFAGSEKVLTDAYEVPGSFTKAGWNFVMDAIAHSERYFSGESWVVGDSTAAGGGHSTLAADLAGRYRTDFTTVWRQYLQSGALVRFASLKDGAQKLEQLAGESSPLSQWLSLAAENTSVDAAMTDGAFQPVAAAQTALARYRESLAALSASIEKVVGQRAAAGDTAAGQALALSQQTLQATKQIETSFHADAAGHLDATIARMFEEPIAGARSVLRAGGPAEWNARGNELCAQMKPVMSKYPFTPGAGAQASVQEIAAIFQPESGTLWKFYKASLQKLILRQGPRFIASASAGLPVNPAFLLFLNRAAAFSDAAFAGGASLPKLRYTLRPVLTAGMDSVKFSVDGQNATFRLAAAGKPFVWPGSATPEIRLSVKSRNRAEYNWAKPGTLWSVFQFFDAAERRQGSQMEIPLHGQAPNLWIEVVATPPVFDRGYFSGLACVAEVVKP
jgi:type VI protein secretion system component VasK